MTRLRADLSLAIAIYNELLDEALRGLGAVEMYTYFTSSKYTRIKYNKWLLYLLIVRTNVFELFAYIVYTIMRVVADKLINFIAD